MVFIALPRPPIQVQGGVHPKGMPKGCMGRWQPLHESIVCGDRTGLQQGEGPSLHARIFTAFHFVLHLSHDFLGINDEQ